MCGGGQFPLEGALGAAGTMLMIMGTFKEPHVNHSFGKYPEGDLHIHTELTSFHVHDLIDSQNALVR